MSIWPGFKSHNSDPIATLFPVSSLFLLSCGLLPVLTPREISPSLTKLPPKSKVHKDICFTLINKSWFIFVCFFLLRMFTKKNLSTELVFTVDWLHNYLKHLHGPHQPQQKTETDHYWIPEKTKRKTLTINFLTFKILKLLKKNCVHLHNFNFKSNSLINYHLKEILSS